MRGSSRSLWLSSKQKLQTRNIFLWQNSSLIKNHNLLENPLLFPTEITNLLFVIKTRQPLKQNFLLNCMETMVKKKEWLQVLRFVTLRCGILTLKTSDSFFRSFRFLRQNETFSATEQNLTYNHSFFLQKTEYNSARRYPFWTIPFFSQTKVLI